MTDAFYSVIKLYKINGIPCVKISDEMTKVNQLCGSGSAV